MCSDAAVSSTSTADFFLALIEVQHTCLSTGIFFRREKRSVKSNTGALQHRNDVKALERGGRALAAARGASLLS